MLTEQIPINVLDELMRQDEETPKEQNSTCLRESLYRLVNGVPVIRENDDSNNLQSLDLIVDDEASIMSIIYNLAYVKERTYDLS